MNDSDFKKCLERNNLVPRKPMKVKELIKELGECDTEYGVVMNIIDDRIDSSTYIISHVSYGWKESGIVSLESGECIMS